MAAQLARLFGVDMVWRVDYVAVYHQLADVVKVAGDLYSFNFLLAPTQFPSNDLAIAAHSIRQTVRVNPNADVSHHGADSVKILARKLVSTCLTTEPRKTSKLAPNDH